MINQNKNLYNIGAGVGVSFKTKISFTAMLGYQMFDVLGIQNFYPTGEISLMFQTYRHNKKTYND